MDIVLPHGKVIYNILNLYNELIYFIIPKGDIVYKDTVKKRFPTRILGFSA